MIHKLYLSCAELKVPASQKKTVFFKKILVIFRSSDKFLQELEMESYWLKIFFHVNNLN